MKKAILLLMMLAAGRLFAQQTSKFSEPVLKVNPNIVYKPDTIHFIAPNYKVAPGSKVVQLLKKMEGFEIIGDTAVTSQGQAINYVRINGKHYDGMELGTVINRLPAEVVASIEIIDDYERAAALASIKSGDPDKLLNINTKPGIIIDMRSFGFTGGGRPDIIRFPNDQRRITDLGTYRLRNADQFNIADRTEQSRQITRQIERLQYDLDMQGRDVNMYGDMMPHFLPGYELWPGPGNKKKKKAVVADSVKTVRNN